MFKLKQVELTGFKSFADRTRLAFQDGVAAIVGPNGCGKSNLSDAINWVLGEQSARSLRGERMADLIFNGTSRRPAIGLAEVSLTLVEPEAAGPGGDAGVSPLLLVRTNGEPSSATDADASNDRPNGNGSGNGSRHGNGDGSHSAAESNTAGHRFSAGIGQAVRHRPGEITVTRRLFRSGESEYLINGDTCRLRDIQDLFMGTGLGPESYAIIEQGRIGQVLSSKPSDRRAIIEEAAGVSKFKTRKRLAEAKLESSRQNLARITDILEEVTKQVNALKRQASKARRYRELHGQMRERLQVVTVSRLLKLQGECSGLRDQSTAIQASCTEAAQALEALEREEKTRRREHEDAETELKALREAAAQRDLERERLAARLAHIEESLATLGTRSSEAMEESRRLEVQAESLEREAAQRAAQSDQVREEAATAQKALAGLVERQERLSIEVSQRESEVEAGRQELLAAVAHAADLRNQLVQAEEIGLALDRQLARMRSESEGIAEEHRRLGADLDASNAERKQQLGFLFDLERALAETTALLDQARAEETGKRQQLESLRQKMSAATARKQALEESLARHAYTTETVRRLLSGNLPTNGHHFQPFGVLADFVEVSPGYEEVVEEFLKGELDCVVVAGHEEARSGISLLKHEGSGRSTFFLTQVPAAGSSASQSADLTHAEGVAACVRDLIRFAPRLGVNGEPAFPDLARAYVVHDAAAAERLAAAHPDCHFLTPDGEHHHHRLITGGKGASAGPLALRRDFRELERKTIEIAGAIQAGERELESLRGRVLGLEAETRRLAVEKVESEKKSALAGEKLRQLQSAFDRTAERLRVLTGEMSAIGEERASIVGRQSSLGEKLAAAAELKQRHEAGIAQVAGTLRDLRAALDTLSPQLAEAHARTSALQERARSMEAAQERLASTLRELRARLERLAEQREGWRREQDHLTDEAAQAGDRRMQLEGEQQAAAQILAAREERSRAAHRRAAELVPAIEAARAELDSRREKRSETEVALARAESESSHAAAQCREELHAEPAELLAGSAPQSALTGESLEAAEAELREMRLRLENMGPVNMMALEELQEAEDRFTFLETQRQDLLASIDDTAQAIREIDEVSRQQFLEAFSSINAYFAESFRTLFGGGSGQMRLTDETDAESGIDMVAQPPGKRLQNVLLLSGGEKALTALALLMALFRYTPSPFCILDEVDAPLDESNVDRFARLIEEMSRQTQFILITHNKRTMEMARLLYGVTMEDPGVSKLVSVRFDEIAREPAGVEAAVRG